MSEEGPKHAAAESTTTTQEEPPKQDAESTTTTETPIISTPAIQTMTSDGIAGESSETKPVTDTQSGDDQEVAEEVAALACCACCACCAACTLFVICLPCEIVGFVTRCLLAPCKWAVFGCTCCCLAAEDKLKPPVPESESAA